MTRSIHINTERTWRGGEKQTLLLVTGLNARGHAAELICPPGSPLEERARAAGVQVRPLRMRGELDLFAVARLRRLMRSGGFEVCQMHTSHAHALGVMARGFRPRPFTVVNRRVDFSIHRRGMFGLNRIKYRHGVDRYIAVSHAIREVLVRDGVQEERIEVVHSGVDPLPPPQVDRATLRARLGAAPDDIVVGNIAHFAAHKGQIFLARAFSLLAGRLPRVRCVLVGDGEERARVEAEIAQLRVGAAVRLVGFQSDVASYLAAFDLFVMPSLLEGLCTSLLDALLAGLPVIGSRAGGIPEIIRDGETGLLVPPGDAAALAAAIERYVAEPAFARRLAAEGRVTAAESFSVARMVEGTLEVYRKLGTGEAKRDPHP